jgi:nucleoside phosphorylase
MLAIFSALEEEIGDYKKTLQLKRLQACREYKAWSGQSSRQECLLVLTGQGKEQAGRTAGWILGHYPVSLVISTGFGGALNEKTKAGDVIVYSRLVQVEMDGQTSARAGAISCSPGPVTQAMSCRQGPGYRIIKGNGVTIAAVCSTAEAKARLGRELEADVVDMESYWIGQAASQKDIPFLAVRSIFDAVQDDLSLLERISVNGKIAPGKVLGQLLAHPSCLGEFTTFYRNYRKAAQNLAVFLDELSGRL